MELSVFVCLHHKCVCQSQAYALCMFTTLLRPTLHLRETIFFYSCNTEGAVSYLFLNLKLLSINLLSSSGIPYYCKCCCCSFSTNLFSLWLPFSQSSPSPSFLSYAHPLLLTLSLSYSLLYPFLLLFSHHMFSL